MTSGQVISKLKHDKTIDVKMIEVLEKEHKEYKKLKDKLIVNTIDYERVMREKNSLLIELKAHKEIEENTRKLDKWGYILLIIDMLVIGIVIGMFIKFMI